MKLGIETLNSAEIELSLIACDPGMNEENIPSLFESSHGSAATDTLFSQPARNETSS